MDCEGAPESDKVLDVARTAGGRAATNVVPRDS
jgi:hypothetical protein